MALIIVAACTLLCHSNKEIPDSSPTWGVNVLGMGRMEKCFVH